MPGFLPKVKFFGTTRKRGSYHVFGIWIGAHVIVRHLRYYPESKKIWMPKRKHKARNKYITDLYLTKELMSSIVGLCKERWPADV